MDIDVKDLYESLASYKGMPFPLAIPNYFSNIKNKWEDRINYIFGANGESLICPVTLKWIDQDDGLQIINLGGTESFDINIQPIVSVKGEKDIELTKLEGGISNGTAKEYLGFKDYKITITGVVINKESSKEYPYQQRKILNSIWLAKSPVLFISDAHNELFNQIVVKNIDFKPVAGKPSIQSYEIKALSDDELIVENLIQD